jgi:hypothetical protein
MLVAYIEGAKEWNVNFTLHTALHILKLASTCGFDIT